MGFLHGNMHYFGIFMFGIILLIPVLKSVIKLTFNSTLYEWLLTMGLTVVCVILVTLGLYGLVA